MRGNRKNIEAGFGHIGLLAILVVIAVIGFVGWRVMSKSGNKQVQNTENTNAASEQKAELSDVRWENTSEKSWMAIGTPPKCPEPFTIKSPTDLSKATSVLYPGQERRGGKFEGLGGNYKPHGGFRFDNSQKTSDVQVVASVSGYVYRGGQYMSFGEIQYTFDIIHPCGYLVRVGHLRELSDTFKKYADKFPPAQDGDSRTERIEGFPAVKAGDTIATAVGYNGGPNIGFDLGVFDLRQTNEASKDSAYQAKWADAREHFYYGVCWFDMLPAADAKLVKSLPPGDPVSGKTSDYCQ